MLKFIKTISFGCETQSLIAVLTLYTGFHAFSTTTLTSFPPAREPTLLSIQCRECIPGTFRQRGSRVCLVTSLVGSGGKADCVVGAERVIFCDAGMPEELFIVDGLPACRRSHTMERQNSKCSTVCSLLAGRSQ
jgi:hypothetical protein